jgi:hypothetical protein
MGTLLSEWNRRHNPPIQRPSLRDAVDRHRVPTSSLLCAATLLVACACQSAKIEGEERPFLRVQRNLVDDGVAVFRGVRFEGAKGAVADAALVLTPAAGHDLVVASFLVGGEIVVTKFQSAVLRQLPTGDAWALEMSGVSGSWPEPSGNSTMIF